MRKILLSLVLSLMLLFVAATATAVPPTCGNNVCELYETVYSCFQDCPDASYQEMLDSLNEASILDPPEEPAYEEPAYEEPAYEEPVDELPPQMNTSDISFEGGLSNETYMAFIDESSGVTFTLETSNSGKKMFSGVADKNTKNAKGVDILFEETTYPSTTVTIGGLKPNTEYHMYKSNYHNHQAFTSDANGKYTFNQGTSKKVHIWVQETKSTKFIMDDATGGDCTSIGNWDAGTKTCTLNTDVKETIQIDSDDTGLDCDGHSIIGVGEYAVFLNANQTTVKNCVISNFTEGVENSIQTGGHHIIYNEIFDTISHHIRVYSNNNIIANNTLSRYSSQSTQMLVLGVESNNNVVENNSIFVSGGSAQLGIAAWQFASNNVIRNNIIISSDYGTMKHGIALFNTNFNNTLENNFISGQGHDGGAGIYVRIWSYNNTISNNVISNIISNGFELDRAYNNIIKNNLVQNCNQGFYLQDTTENNVLFNNTIKDSRSKGISISGDRVDGNQLINNLISTSGSTGIYIYDI